MFSIQIADINVTIKNKYDYVQNLCRDYIVDDIITGKTKILDHIKNSSIL